MPIELLWALRDVEYAVTPTGVEITVTTFHACHLWMRWSTIYPQEHLLPRIVRGLPVKADKRYCFVVYHDNEQEEAGDTYVHTFLKEPWAHCEVRYFYFFGTIGGSPSPSTSAIFSYHREYLPLPPVTQIFYPDEHPELTSVDSYVEHIQFNQVWANIRDGAGTAASPSLDKIFVLVDAHRNTNKWSQMSRSALLFDTSVIPPAAITLSATFRCLAQHRVEAPHWPLASVCLVSSFPASNTNIVPSDYPNFGVLLLSDTIILINQWWLDSWKEYPLNAAGLDSIAKGSITKLGLRENQYDRRNIAPPWFDETASAWAWSADKGVGFKPELEVTWQP